MARNQRNGKAYVNCLTLRGIKGSALTHGELDNNFLCLDTAISSLNNYVSTNFLPLSGGIISKTYTEISTLIINNELVQGAFYNITDRCDSGLIIQAINGNKLSINGVGLFLNPDFQDVGDYSGLLIPKGNNKGVWFLAGQSGVGAFANDDIVFWVVGR